ncbi:MAG: O-antigen ligase family protein, partial [Alphaproteobacteria bacterium]
YFVKTYGSLAGEILRSFDIRLQLWAFAWQFAAENFPWGIGLNQFGAYIANAGYAETLHVASVHNTPLRLLMELGVLGIGIFGVVVALVVLGGRKLLPYQRAMLYLYIFTPMILHDALGLRIFHVVLAFCLATAFFQTGPAPKTHRSP